MRAEFSRVKSNLIGFFTFLIFTSIVTNSVFAFSPHGDNITISPTLEQISIQNITEDKSFPLTVTNNTNETKIFSLSIVDFGPLTDSAGLAFLGKSSDALSQKYSLHQWMSVSPTSLTLRAKTSDTATVSIHTNSSLSAGVHYGAVLTRAEKNLNQSPFEKGKSKLTIIEELATLVFVNRTDSDIFNLLLKDISFPSSLLILPTSLHLKFYNNGNVHVTPRGNILLINPNGKLIKQGIINRDSALLLPESFRQIEATFKTIEDTAIPGTYTITVNYRFDGKENFDQMHYTFFFLGLPLLFLLSTTILLTICIITVFFLTKRYKKYLPVVHKTS